MTDCDLGVVSLQAPLEDLYITCSGDFVMHPGFPMTNFRALLSLKIECRQEDEEAFFPELPLMESLQTLDLSISEGKLLKGLPRSLRNVQLHYYDEGWNDCIIPALQQLPKAEDLRIDIQLYQNRLSCMLSHDLMPFMAMQKLSLLQLGSWEVWASSSLKALGQ